MPDPVRMFVAAYRSSPVLRICHWGFPLACLTSRAKPWFPEERCLLWNILFCQERRGLQGHRSLGYWLLLPAWDYTCPFFHSRACVFLRTKSFLSSGQGCFWLINAGAGEGTRALEEDGEWQMLCHKRTLDGACINNWDVPWNLSQGQIYSCTASCHPLCFLILSCSLCWQDSEFCFHFLISCIPLAHVLLSVTQN